MSKKRAKRNTKAVLKKLRLKRHSGGHTAFEKGAGGHIKEYNKYSGSYSYKGSDHTHSSIEEANVGTAEDLIEDPVEITPSLSPVVEEGVTKDAPIILDQTAPTIDAATKKAVTDRAVQQTAIGQLDSSDIQKLKAGKGEEVPLVSPLEVTKMANKEREPDLRYDANKDGEITSGDALAYLKGEFTPEKVFKDVDNTEKLRSLGISTDSDVQKLGTATDATAGTVGSRDDTTVATRTAAQGTAASFPGLTDQQINDFKLEIRNSDEIQRLINEMAESADQVHNSPEYKEYLKRYGESRGKDVEAFEALKKAQEPLKVLSQEIEDLENKKLEEKVRTESGRAKTFEASKIAEEDIGTTTAAQADTTEEAESKITATQTDATQSQEAKDLTAAKADDQEVEKAKVDQVTRPGDKLTPKQNRANFQETAEYKELIKGPVTRDMYEASDGTVFSSGTIGGAYDRYLENLPEVSVDYAQAVTTAKEYGIDLDSIEDPNVKDMIAKTISERDKEDILSNITTEGVDIEKVAEYATLNKSRVEQSGTAATQEIYNTLGEEPSVDLEGRKAITGEAPVGDAAQIGGVPTMQHASRQGITGAERSTGAADMLKVVANVPTEVVAALSEEPATVEKQIDTNPDPKVVAAVASLPEEALVSVQMEKLLEGIEEGKTPVWARPAVAAVNRMMSQRGLSASTVGRDALFNAIIQTALPMAQSNAQALQERATQNLNNQQQAVIDQAKYVAQIRLQNLANSQTAASQTAEMANQIKVQQGQFRQQAVLTTAQQAQQSELATFQAAQAKAQQESAQRQQSIIAGFDANARMDLANLQALNAADAQSLTNEQQARLTTYNARINRIMRQADLEQDMEKANLSTELRIELANLTEQNAAAKDTMTAENQERLTNLQVLVDFKKTNASLAQQMDLANLTNKQQMELANLAERAATDSTNMTETNKLRLSELSLATSTLAKNADLRQRAELAKLSSEEKIELANLAYENQAEKENMTAENLASLKSFEARMKAGEVNAQLAQQLGLANLSNEQSAAMFNAQINAQLDISQFNFEQQAALANSKFMQNLVMTEMSNEQQLTIQNATTLATMDLQNADARTRVSVENAKSFLSRDLANLTNKQQGIMLDRQQQQQALLSNQAAENAAKQFGATSQNQIDQYMIGQANIMEQFNVTATNSMAQFNATEKNRMAAMDAGNQLQVDALQAQLDTEVSKFNAQIDDQRDRWNAQNAQAIEQSNINWRRQSNTIDTAAQNAANQQNAQNSYNLTALEQTQLWQQLRDEAAYIRTSYESEQQRKTQLVATAMTNESGTYGTSTSALAKFADILD